MNATTQMDSPEVENRIENGGPNRVRRKRARIIIAVVLVVAAATALWYYLDTRRYETTDNAFIDADIVQISPRAYGQVVRVLVNDNQHVNPGDVLAEIDPSDYEARLEEAKAKLADTMAKAGSARSNLALTSTVTGAVLIQAGAAFAGARQQTEVLKARLGQDDAAIQAAEAVLQQAEARRTAAEAEAARAASDGRRYRALFEKDEVSKQMLDRAETDARSTAANAEAARQSIAGARAQLAQARAGKATTQATLRQTQDEVRQAEGRVQEAQSAPQQVRVRESDVQAVNAQIEQARAAVRLAELNLSYTKIVAPDSGWITRKSIQAGNFVQVGQALMALVSDRLWVVANFKETQLRHMRQGQPVAIRIDAYPQLKLKGRVDSMQTGTGARFSLMPPENATGNYVKVVQRVPVKIVFTEPPPAEYKIGPGMSVIPEVQVR
jgi:membrane fusion protein (multidrug efflux system)